MLKTSKDKLEIEENTHFFNESLSGTAFQGRGKEIAESYQVLTKTVGKYEYVMALSLVSKFWLGVPQQTDDEPTAEEQMSDFRQYKLKL